ncbi:MAG: hypothetical protein Q9182_003177 [Xanthomendoza sp. 2 TL-2023]
MSSQVRKMQKPLHSVVFLLATIAGTMAQTTTKANPLNDFLGSVNSAAADISSANARATPPPSSSTSPIQPATTSASPSPAPVHSGINRTTLIVAVVCAVIGALLIGLLLGLCCWCLARRRRRRRQDLAHQPIDDEVHTWRSHEPKQPGRDYSPHRTSRVASMEQQPMIPPAAKAPDMLQHHPALRNDNAENPFVPVPPSPRRSAPNSRAGLTDGTVPGAAPYILPAEAQRLHKARSRSNSRPRTGSNPALPPTNTGSRPSTPFGLSGIGQPYEDMHVHVLQTDHPSRELRQSLQHREPIASPPSEPIRRYDTPPTGVASHNPLSQNPHRSSTASASNNNMHTATNSTVETSSTEGSTSGPDDWRYNKASTTFAGVPPWEQRQHRYSNSPPGSGSHSNMPAAPPIPWEDRETRYQSPSHSPRQSRDGKGPSGSPANAGGYVEGHRRNSRSPATSINGQPRRLRFSDLQADDMGYGGSYRHSQGVGEAL